jgi:hypothetical protein
MPQIERNGVIGPREMNHCATNDKVDQIVDDETIPPWR